MNFEKFIKFLPSLLQNIPQEWVGTTYRNDKAYVGREKFTESLFKVIEANTTGTLSREELETVGNAEDYLRVASNPATVLEIANGLKYGFNDIDEVYSFVGSHMNFLSVIFSRSIVEKSKVYVYSNEILFSEEEIESIRKLVSLVDVQFIVGKPNKHDDGLVLSVSEPKKGDEIVDGFCYGGLLFINHPEKIDHAEILVRRKRMSGPDTTPNALSRLRQLAGLETEELPAINEEAYGKLTDHLKQLSGLENEKEKTDILITNTGLAALNTFHTSLIAKFGGADVVLASTAYGGSDKLASIMQELNPSTFKKHPYDIQGDLEVTKSIIEKLDSLISIKDTLTPTTVILIEIPTNPDMKVPLLKPLIEKINDYKKITQRQPVLLIDTTFSPKSQIIKQIKDIDEELPVVVFISLSKSVSAGKTTGGALIANETNFARDILSNTHKFARIFDTKSKHDQINILINYHADTEKRIDLAYENAVQAEKILQQSITPFNSGKPMYIHFVTPEQASLNIKPATFSFNLPVPKGLSSEEIKNLSQKYVDILCTSKIFKPCVSFGQEGTLVYATVPATSTQGDIKLEDKEKQAVGGVQLVRLSFPPILDLVELERILNEAAKACLQTNI